MNMMGEITLDEAVLIAARKLSQCLIFEEERGVEFSKRTDRAWLALTTAIEAVDQDAKERRTP
jgi:hypothetical protein